MADGLEMTVTFNTAPLDSALAELESHVPEEVNDLMGLLAHEGLDYMSGLTPVRTGYLKSRGQVQIDNMSFTLSNDAEYAPAVNYGTRYQTAQPFFEPAVEYINGEMEAVLGKALT